MSFYIAAPIALELNTIKRIVNTNAVIPIVTNIPLQDEIEEIAETVEFIATVWGKLVL